MTLRIVGDCGHWTAVLAGLGMVLLNPRTMRARDNVQGIEIALELVLQVGEERKFNFGEGCSSRQVGVLFVHRWGQQVFVENFEATVATRERFLCDAEKGQRRA